MVGTIKYHRVYGKCKVLEESSPTGSFRVVFYDPPDIPTWPSIKSPAGVWIYAKHLFDTPAQAILEELCNG